MPLWQHFLDKLEKTKQQPNAMTVPTDIVIVLLFRNQKIGHKREPVAY